MSKLTREHGHIVKAIYVDSFLNDVDDWNK